MASQVPSTSIQSYEIQGRTVALPVEVRDASAGNVMYDVEAQAVARLLPGDAFEVVETAPGRTQLIVGLIDYRDNDLGNYNEVSIAFSVAPRGAGPEDAGTFIYKLPVDQAFTCEAGCKIWGYPKTVEKIDLDYADDFVTGRLEMEGQHVFTLTVPRRQPETAEPLELPMRTYSYIEGVPHDTAFRNRSTSTVSPGPDGVELTLGDHPLAEELRSLGLPKPPLMSVWTEHMSAVFEAPTKVG